MTNLITRFILFWILQNSFQLSLNVLAALVLSSAILGGSSAIASAEPAQITLSIDATSVPFFSDLVNQAESLAEIEFSRRFQADPSINELQITVLGERNGQLVSLLSSKVSRNAWQASSDIHQWTRYFATSSVLLGYRNSDPISRQRSVVISRTPSLERTSSEAIEQARLSGRISEQEYWQLADAID